MDNLMEKTVKKNLGWICNTAPLPKYHIIQMKRDVQNPTPCLEKYIMSKVLLLSGKG